MISAALNGKYNRAEQAVPSSYERSPERRAIGPRYQTLSIEGIMIAQGRTEARMAGIPVGNAAALFQISGSMVAGLAFRKANHSSRKTQTIGPVR